MLCVSLWTIWAKAVDNRVKLMLEGSTKGFAFTSFRIWDAERINKNNQTQVCIKNAINKSELFVKFRSEMFLPGRQSM